LKKSVDYVSHRRYNIIKLRVALIRRVNNMECTYIVLFDDGYTTTVKAYDTSDAWEKALDIEHFGKVKDVWRD
jgi:hypothetical protein